MRLLFLTQVYPAYLTDFYRRHPSLETAAYAQQHAAFMADAFGWVGAWSGAMRRAGHQATEVIPNATLMQRAWATEADVPSTSRGRLQLALAQIRAFAPDVILLDDTRNFSGQWLQHVRELVPSLRCIVTHVGSPWHDVEAVRACDAVLCVSRAYAQKMREVGCRSYFFRHAFNKDILGTIAPAESSTGTIAFCGSFLRGADGHSARERVFEALVSHVPVDIHAPQYGKSRVVDVFDTAARRIIYHGCNMLAGLGVPRTVLRRLPVVGKGANWGSAPVLQVNPRLHKHMKPALYGTPMYNALAAASLTVHVHGAAAGNEAVGMRLFEATGVGACLLTDRQADLREIFDPEHEVASFGSPQEAVACAKWLLRDDTARRQIAAAGQARTLREHTFDNRVPEFEAIVSEACATS